MGTQVFTDDSETDAESIIQYTRKQKKPPEFIPRSRSLNDLPGGLRVPIVKKQESRLQQKHEANEAGLEELRMLRQQHGQMIDDVRATSGPQDTRRSSNQLRLSSSSLACIKEESVLQNDVQSQVTNIHYTKARFSIASDDSLQDGSSCASDKSESINTSMESLNLSMRDGEEPSEVDSRTNEQILKEFRQQFEGTCDIPSSGLQSKRRASIQVVPLTRPPPPVDNSIRPKLRRASFQCEAVMTKTFEREEPISKVISDFKLQYNFPSPLHAITRQYGSSSDVRVKEKVEAKPSARKELKSILTEWESDKLSYTPPRKGEVIDQSANSDNSESFSNRHSRNLSCTSDYFGSTDTLNTVRTFPLPVRASREELPKRRQSLPVNLMRKDSLSDPVPKIPERRKSFLHKGTSYKTENVKTCLTNHKTRLSESDDGIFHEDSPFKENTNELPKHNKLNTLKSDKANRESAKLPLETAL